MRIRLRHVLPLGLGLALACGFFPSTLDKAKTAEKSGKYDEAVALYQQVYKEAPAGSPEQTEAFTLWVRAEMAMTDRDSATRDEVLTVYRATTAVPELAAEADAWLGRHLPEVPTCLGARDTASSVKSWEEAQPALDACSSVMAALCEDGPCPSGYVDEKDRLPLGRTAAQIDQALRKALHLVTGMGYPLSSLEAQFRSHWKKDSTEGPTSVPWPSDGKVHQVNKSLYLPGDNARKRNDNLFVFTDASTGKVIGVQTLLMDLFGDTAEKKVQYFLWWVVPGEAGIEEAAAWVAKDHDAFSSAMAGKPVYRKFANGDWGIQLMVLRGGDIAIMVFDSEVTTPGQ